MKGAEMADLKRDIVEIDKRTAQMLFNTKGVFDVCASIIKSQEPDAVIIARLRQNIESERKMNE